MCIFCEKDNVKDVLTNYERTISGRKIIVKNVPALYCETCGEYYFSNEVVSQIKEQLKKISEMPEYVEIYDFATKYRNEMSVLARI